MPSKVQLVFVPPLKCLVVYVMFILTNNIGNGLIQSTLPQKKDINVTTHLQQRCLLPWMSL